MAFAKRHSPTVYQRYTYTAAGSETSVTGADDNGDVLDYDPATVEVKLDGVTLLEGDYVSTTGTTISGLAALTAGQTLEVIAIGDSGNPIQSYTKAASDAKYELAGAVSSVNPNLIINGGFQVNQRVYVSTTATADGTYMHDRWRSGETDSSYTFSSASPASPQTVTIAANDSIEQVIEGANVGTAGTHTISWTGTATARAVVNTQTMSGNYAVSPITVTAVLDQVITVQFTGADAAGGSTTATDTGTLGLVKCELGSSATAFEPEAYGDVLLRCRRYFERWNINTASTEYIMTGSCTSSTDVNYVWNYQVQKRVAPTFSFPAASGFDNVVGAAGYTSSAIAGTSQIGVHSGRILCTVSGASAGAASLRRNGTNTCYLDADAEL
jgi:hypothetical protein